MKKIFYLLPLFLCFANTYSQYRPLIEKDTLGIVKTRYSARIDSARVADSLTAHNTRIIANVAATLTNATAITLKVDKSELPVNLKAISGASGDGVSDDRAVIQASYNTQYALGKRMFYLPAATYLMTTSAIEGIIANLFIKPGTILYGDGDATVIKRSSSTLSGYAIEYVKSANDAATLSNRNYTIRNIKILGSTGVGYETPGATNTDGGIFLGTATLPMNNVLIENVTVENVNKEAVAVWDAVSCRLLNNKVLNANHDAYNPQKIVNLIMTGNYANNVNFFCEYDGSSSTGATTKAIISNNQGVDIQEYGISIEAGDNVVIQNNQLIAGTTTSVTGQSIGVFLNPSVGSIGTLAIHGNYISGFKQTGIDNSSGSSGDYVIHHLIIKNNDISSTATSPIALSPYNSIKILKTEIFGNTLYNWNTVDNGNSFQYSAIALQNITNVSIHNNRIYHDSTANTRTDPLWVSNCSNVTFYGNDCNSNPSQYYSTVEIRKSNTNTNIVSYNNPGLGGGVTGGIVMIPITIGDETTAITTGTAKVTFRMPFAMRLNEVRASLTTASSSGLPTFDIKSGGTSLLSTLLSINASSKTSVGATTAAVITGVDNSAVFSKAIAADAEITIDVTTAGTGAKGAKIYLIGFR